MEKKINSEAKLSFSEATGVIIGHGVGTGILTVPFLTSLNTWWHFVIVLAVAFFFNTLLHLMIAELSYNHDGAQFVTCIDRTLLKNMKPKAKKIFAICAFLLIALAVTLNVASYMSGGADAFISLFFSSIDVDNPPMYLKCIFMLVFYLMGALVVYFGMKIVGICEKYTVFCMIAVMFFLTVVTLTSNNLFSLPKTFISFNNILALYGMISFSLSSVMSVPTVVKGLNGDVKKIRLSIILGIGINVLLISILTIVTLLGCGGNLVKSGGAIVNLANQLNLSYVRLVGCVFTLFALVTSFWANTLDLRDIISEQTKKSKNFCWLLSSTPGFVIAYVFVLLGLKFADVAMIASAIQIITGIAIIVAYNVSRRQAFKKVHEITDKTELKEYRPSPIIGNLGTLLFQILVVSSSLAATVGSIIKVATK